MATEDGTKSVSSAMKVMTQAGEDVRVLAEALEASAQAATQIVASAGQQSVGVAQIHQAMKNIDAAATQTAQATRATEKVAASMNTTATQLKESLKSFAQ
jgi:methyl-accepting chemotaxis protein